LLITGLLDIFLIAPSTSLPTRISGDRVIPVQWLHLKRKVERKEKVLVKKFGYFLSISQQVVSADITKSSGVAILES
jgi:hypothetical protein